MNLKKGAHIHLMGICGTAMASLAGLLKNLGYKITGSDQNVYPPMSTQLRDLGIDIMEGYKKENLSPRPDLVIVGNVISKTHEEAKALLETDIPYTSLPQAMGDFAIGSRNSIICAGTHGKTTTTSMMIRVADECGVKPGYMVGGIPEDYGRSFRVAEGNYFIIEGDEYDTAFFDKVPKFVHYKPKYVILTSIEFDHADIYADLEAVKKAFRRLIELIPADGLLVVCAESPVAVELAKSASCRVITYGVARGDYQIVDRMMISGRNHFTVQVATNKSAQKSIGGNESQVYEKIGDLALKSPGEHNALNATAVFAVARELKWDLAKILQGLANFKGVKRRQEVIGTPSGVTLIEDFAHHPTAVRVTIDAIRERYPGQKLVCLFEPRSATSRRKVFQKDYVQAFQFADRVMIAKAYDQTRIAEEDRFSTAELVHDLKTSGKNAGEFQNADEMVNDLKMSSNRGDVVLIMSNGGFDGIYGKLLKTL